MFIEKPNIVTEFLDVIRLNVADEFVKYTIYINTTLVFGGGRFIQECFEFYNYYELIHSRYPNPHELSSMLISVDEDELSLSMLSDVIKTFEDVNSHFNNVFKTYFYESVEVVDYGIIITGKGF
jgi:hypothetical protein